MKSGCFAVGKVSSRPDRPELISTPTGAPVVLQVDVDGSPLELRGQKPCLIKRIMQARTSDIIKAEYYQLQRLNVLDWIAVYE